jgi:hypothetical protein
MVVQELEMTDLFEVHFVFKEKMPSWQFYCKGKIDWPSIPDYMDPARFDNVILQFKATKEDFKKAGRHAHSIEEKFIDRLKFLKILLEVDLTSVDKKRIELAWNPNCDDPITYDEEPLLRQFEAKQVINYYKELDDTTDKMHHRIDVTKVGHISMKDTFRIIMGAIIEEATGYAPIVAAASTHTCNNATAMATMKKKRERAAERLEAKSVGKLGRMRGPKQDMRQVVASVAELFEGKFKPVLDEVFYFEFAEDDLGERVMRRNAAWEFVVQMDARDLIRPMRLVLEIPTLRQDLTGWTAAAMDKQAREAKKADAASLEEETKQHFLFARWLRQKILHIANVHDLQQKFKRPSALDLAKQKKRGSDALSAAQSRSMAAKSDANAAAKGAGEKTWHRKVESIEYPALKERQRMREEGEVSDLERTRGKAWKLFDALENMDD